MSEPLEETTEPNPDAEPDVEPEHIDGGDDGQENDPEAAKPTGPSSEAVMQAADKENRRYIAKLEKILGPDESRHECPACNGLGVTWGDTEELPELLFAEDTEPCAGCNALGIVKTGALNPEQATMPHSACGGRGWITKVAPIPPVAALPPYTPPADQPIAGQYVPGRGFVPYGATEPLAGSLTG